MAGIQWIQCYLFVNKAGGDSPSYTPKVDLQMEIYGIWWQIINICQNLGSPFRQTDSKGRWPPPNTKGQDKSTSIMSAYRSLMIGTRADQTSCQSRGAKWNSLITILRIGTSLRTLGFPRQTFSDWATQQSPRNNQSFLSVYSNHLLLGLPGGWLPMTNLPAVYQSIAI